MDQPNRQVVAAILAFPEVTASTVYGMLDLFRSAGRDWGFITSGTPGEERIRPYVVSRVGSPFRAANDVWIHPDCTLHDCPTPDVVCIPEVFVPPGEPLDGRFDHEIAWIRDRYRDGATITTACSGALLLAEGGLLDGCEATTHWAYCDVMQRRHPRIRVVGQRAIVATGDGQRLVMAGGGTTWLDAALFVIARFVGVEEAMQVARLSLIDWHGIGQQPFARLSCARQGDDAVIARCQAWIAVHYAQSAPVAAMTAYSGLTDRSFNRRFRRATGMTPLDYVHTLRLEEAKQMLECGDEAIEAIAQECGYEDAGFFARLFRRKVGLTPAQYRRRFGSMRRVLGAAVTRHTRA
jgi:transcriptional regulator GlxA family with amidase domain